jgi:hypothetical protein
MSERDYNLGAQKFPEQIELCGVCGRRVHRCRPTRPASTVRNAARLKSTRPSSTGG